MHLLVFGDEAAASIRIFGRVSRRKHVLSSGAQNAQGSLIIRPLHCSKESIDGIVG
jgi:hypothetical protein